MQDSPLCVEVALWNSALWRQAIELRIEVFVVEQHVPMEEEQDDIDVVAYHVVVMNCDAAVGTGRLFAADDKNEVGKIGRMAVAKSHRGRGVGSLIMEALMAEGRRRGYGEFQLSAQVHAIPFYERHGFQVASETYDDAGIPHRTMARRATD